MASKQKEQELWLGFARDAMANFRVSDEVEDTEECVDTMIEVATDYADGMLDEFEKRYGGGIGRRRRKEEDDE